MAQPDLFVWPFGPYPRRVLIYLAEKGITSHFNIIPVEVNSKGQMSAPGKPPGTVPILKLPDGSYISQSLAIVNYIEDVCENPQEDWQQALSSAAKPISARGTNPMERARTLEVLSLADEVSSLLGLTWHKGSVLFDALEQSSEETARLCFVHASKILKKLDEIYGSRQTELEVANVADIVLFTTLQFSREFYDFDAPKTGDWKNLDKFYEAFKVRKSAAIDEGFYPEDIRSLAVQWHGDLNKTAYKALQA